MSLGALTAKCGSAVTISANCGAEYCVSSLPLPPSMSPTTTLGCGSWGGNSISENLDYKHLMNVSRIGKVITGKKVPTDEEIWA